MPRWSLHCLGGEAVRSSLGGEVRLSDAAWPVLGCLLASPRFTLTRGQIAAALWPNQSEEAARHCLATALWRMRAKTGALADWLSVRGEMIALSVRQSIWIDALVFAARAEAALRDPARLRIGRERSRLRRALALYRGDFLPERDQERIVVERERLRALYLDALFELSAAEAAAGEWSLARQSARRLCADEPLREDAQRLYIQTLERTGNRGLAIQQYHELAALLERELSVRPAAETVALARSIGVREPDQQHKQPSPRPPEAEPGSTGRPALLRARQDLARALSTIDALLAD